MPETKNIKLQKKLLRRQLKIKIKELSPNAIKTQTDRIISQIRTHIFWTQAQYIITFIPIKYEINIHALIKLALDTNKTVYAPLPSRKELRLIKIYKTNTLQKYINSSGQIFKLLMPDKNSRSVIHCKPAFIFNRYKSGLILVPGLGFSPGGDRLGRGGAYYDTFLSQIKDKRNIKSIGLCFSCQLLAQIPRDTFDQKVNLVLS